MSAALGSALTLRLDANPVQGQTVQVLIGNVSGSTAIGGLLLGGQQISSPTPFGGTLLVNSFFSETFPMLPASGGTFPLPIPTDSALCGATLYGQGLHSDPGASAGIAFTPGIAIHIGG